MLTVCNNCNYFVHQDDVTCFNCGINKPGANPLWARINFKRLSIIFIVLSVVLFLSVLFLQKVNSIAIAFAVFIIVMLSFIFEGMFSFITKINPNSLWGKENVISNRLEELNSRNATIDKVLSKITESDTSKLLSVKAKLISAKEIVSNQYERYELQQRKIDLIRVQNKLIPTLIEFQTLNDKQLDGGLSAIETAKNEVNTLRKLVSDETTSTFSNQNLPERDSFLEQLNETEISYSRLRESLISKQATNALKDITDFDTRLSENKELAHVVETFNANAEISNFSESFEELETEYKRLKTENDLDERLLI